MRAKRGEHQGDASHGAEQVKVVARAVRQAPAHELQQVKALRYVSEDDDHEAHASRQQQ